MFAYYKQWYCAGINILTIVLQEDDCEDLNFAF